MKRILLCMVILLFASTVYAAPITVGNANWYEFGFGLADSYAYSTTSLAPSSGGNSEFAPFDAPWTFSSSSPTRFSITDAFIKGDRFEVYDFGASLGLTSLVPTSGSSTTDPAIAILDLSYSSAIFALLAGDHSITIRVAQNAADTSSGAGYFRVDPVPEPATMLLLAVGFIGIVGYGRKKF